MMPPSDLCAFCLENEPITDDGGRVCMACLLRVGSWVAHPERISYELVKALEDAHGDIVTLMIRQRIERVRTPHGEFIRQFPDQRYLEWVWNEERHVPGQVPPYFADPPRDWGTPGS